MIYCKSEMHISLYLYLVSFLTLNEFTNAFPLIQIELLQPAGFRLALPQQYAMSQVVFNVNINKPIAANDIGTYSLIVTEPVNGRWVLESSQPRIFYGSTLNFWIIVRYGEKRLEKIGSVIISKPYLEIDDPQGPIFTTPVPPLPSGCERSPTTVGGKPVCKGEFIFGDNFNSMEWAKWSREIRIPLDEDDAEFVSFQRRPENFYIKSGSLYIVPSLLSEADGYDEDSIFDGKLDLEEYCTGVRDMSKECSKQAAIAQILPPVVSARARTRQYFTFRYGRVEVRAKMPKGDWLTPLILLEPVENYYGFKGYASGQMRVASIHGNEYLEDLNGTDISGKVLSGGVVLAPGHQFRKLWMKNSAQRAHLGNDFHIYTLIWSEKSIILEIDGNRYSEIRGGFAMDLRNFKSYARHWENGNFIAPFDREMYVTLGLTVGGHSDFPDSCQTGTNRRDKPWKNDDPKALYQFWGDRKRWYQTWKGEDAGLKVDYVRVYAL